MRQRGYPHGKFFFFHDAFTHQIGKRDFCRRDQPIIGLHAEQIFGKFRQLPRAIHRMVFNQQRGIDLHIAIFARMKIQHELPNCAFKPRQLTFIDDKAGARHFGGCFEIHHPQAFAKIKMLLGFECKGFGLTPDTRDHIAVLIRADRHGFKRGVGDGRQFCVELGDDLLFKRFGIGKAIF